LPRLRLAKTKRQGKERKDKQGCNDFFVVATLRAKTKKWHLSIYCQDKKNNYCQAIMKWRGVEKTHRNDEDKEYKEHLQCKSGYFCARHHFNHFGRLIYFQQGKAWKDN